MKSRTTRFLEQMEAKRLKKPCPRVVDMRGKVPGECQRHDYNGRDYWLDDISYAIFRRGLETNNGIFTVGTYEAIVNGPHTNRAIRESEEKQRAEEAAVEEAARRADEEEAAGPEQRGPELVNFGYYKRRTEDRLQFATRVDIRLGEITLRGKTRNMSVHGLMLYLRGRYHFEAGQAVALTFPDLQTKAGSGARLSAIPYTIMAAQQAGTFASLRLRLEMDDAPESFTQFLGRFIAGYRKRNKLDVDDDFRATLTRAHERLYVENLVTLPFFIARGAAGPVTRAVAVSNGNDYLARFFHLGGPRYDFLAFSVPRRLERLRRQGEMVMTLFREDDRNGARIYCADDGEYDDPEQFLRFTAYALSRPQHLVLKLLAGCQPVRMPPADRFERPARLLGDKWRDALDQIKRDYARLQFAASAVDLTEAARTLLERGTDYLGATPDPAGLSAWCGRSRVALADGRILDDLAEEQMPPPAVADFRLLRSRREERFKAATSVTIAFEKTKVEATSRDISKRGLCIVVDKPIAAQVGDQVSVGFPSLQKKRQGLNLMRLPYQVVKVVPGEEHLIMLQRQRDRGPDGIDDFFDELIASNRDKLSLDEADVRAIASANAWEAVAVENLATLPFFFGRKEEEGMKLRAVALPVDPCCPLADFFHTPRGDYDFSPIATPQITLALRERFLPMMREGNVRGRRPDPVTVEVYLYKQWNAETGELRIHSADNMHLGTNLQRGQFIRQALEHGEYRFIRITATYVQTLEDSYRDELLHRIHRQASYRGLQLDDWLFAIEGYGEMVDITDELESTYRG